MTATRRLIKGRTYRLTNGDEFLFGCSNRPRSKYRSSTVFGWYRNKKGRIEGGVILERSYLDDSKLLPVGVSKLETSLY